MKPTKRQSDPLGRSTTRHRYSRYLLSLAIAITGSVWPIQRGPLSRSFTRPEAPSEPHARNRRSCRPAPTCRWD
jgi:hypothetical protein